MRGKLGLALILASALAIGLHAQNAGTVVAAASKAMGVDNLNSITYSGTARNGAFGQSKALGDPLGTVNNTRITQYTRTVTFAPAADPTAVVSRAFGPTASSPNRRKSTCSRRTRGPAGRFRLCRRRRACPSPGSRPS